jgi:hypothetical protein
MAINIATCPRSRQQVYQASLTSTFTGTPESCWKPFCCCRAPVPMWITDARINAHERDNTNAQKKADHEAAVRHELILRIKWKAVILQAASRNIKYTARCHGLSRHGCTLRQRLGSISGVPWIGFSHSRRTPKLFPTLRRQQWKSTTKTRIGAQFMWIIGPELTALFYSAA